MSPAPSNAAKHRSAIPRTQQRPSPREPDTSYPANLTRLPKTAYNPRKRVRLHSPELRTSPQTTRVVSKSSRENIKYIETPIYPSIMGGPPLVDDRIRYLVHFLLKNICSPIYEFEARLGYVIQERSGKRAINLLPITCETPLLPFANNDTFFDPDIPEVMFQKLKGTLNDRVTESREQTEGKVLNQRGKKIHLLYPKHITEQWNEEQGPDGKMKSNLVKVERRRMLDEMNILCPGRFSDIKYLASRTENDRSSQNERPLKRQEKEYVSYKYRYVTADLIKFNTHDFTTSTSASSFAIDIRMRSPHELFHEVMKYRNKDSTSQLFGMVESFVSTIRLLQEI